MAKPTSSTRLIETFDNLKTIETVKVPLAKLEKPFRDLLSKQLPPITRA